MKSLLPLAVLLFAAALVRAQTAAAPGAGYALFFVVQDFEHWQDLSAQSVAQVRDVEKELKDNYGFSTEFVLNPTRGQIIDKLEAYGKRAFGRQDQLVLYFSMHGHYEEGRIGALIPRDGLLRDNAYQTWIMHPLLEDLVNNIPCEHILLALDACYSGTFEGGRGKPQQPAFQTGDDCAAKAANALRYKSRLFLTSGGKERTPINSQFADKWLEALRLRNADGALTYNGLVGVLEEASPIPRYGEFKGHQKGGSFIFVQRYRCGGKGAPDPLLDRRTDREAWQQAQKTDTPAAYRDYLARFPRGEFRPLADKRLSQLDAALQEERDWENAKRTNTVEAYDDFMRRYPDSPYKDLAAHYRVDLGPAVPADLPGMVFVQGGDFPMGSTAGDSDEKPVHQVTLGDFYIGRHEVTVEDYLAFANATNSHFPEWLEKGSQYNIQTGSNDHYKKLGDALQNKKHPIVGVSWLDAAAYCNWLSEQNGLQKVYTISGTSVTANWNANGYRLPTEAEWEYAARSRGRDEKWAGTSTESELGRFANASGTADGYAYTAPVGSFRANALGLHDMSGNVWEWCWDWKDAYPAGAQTDPKGPATGSVRVIRGGSWLYVPAYLRCANRLNYGSPGDRLVSIGFRLARAAR